MTQQDSIPLDITISRWFDAPPDAVYRQWIEVDALKDWFAPQTCQGLEAKADARVGGAWTVTFQSASGERLTEYGIYKELVPYSRLVMTLTQSFVAAGELTITVTLEDSDGGTLMRFHQTGFTDAHYRNSIAEGWLGCFEKLADRFDAGKVAEIRTLFQAWFEASMRKDLDASMAPIASEVVSYEHSTPLEVRDIEAIRAECKTGFDRSGPDFRWDIPDLEIIVRGDIAVTWGLNRMADHVDGVVRNEMWSRGTRIFQRIDGSWRMIHQHLSFPMDPQTGKARLDLIP